MPNPVDTHFKLSAVIVCYYPEINKLKSLVTLLLHQKVQVIIVDNTPTSDDNLAEALALTHEDLIIKMLGVNAGIAKGQNIGINLAKSNQATHVIFFDQDSAPEQKMIATLRTAEEQLLLQKKSVGAIGPSYLNLTTNKQSKPIQFMFGNLFNAPDNIATAIKCDFLISSGSLIRMEIIEKVGYFNEALFIDGVDVDWILQASSLGYAHYMIPDAKMLHDLGEKKSKVMGVKVSSYSDLRNYYKIRNLTYLLLYTKNNIRFKMTMFLKIPLYILSFILMSEKKVYTIKTLAHALSHGCNKQLGKYESL